MLARENAETVFGLLYESVLDVLEEKRTTLFFVKSVFVDLFF